MAIFTTTRPNGIEISSVPNRALASMEYEVQEKCLDQLIIEGEVYLADILEKLSPPFKDAFDAVSAASWLCIIRYWKAHDTKKQPRGNSYVYKSE
jgi:hypothetical protein